MATAAATRMYNPARALSSRRPDSSFKDDLEESLRVLAPTQKKLTSIESQRIMCVAIETSKRLKRALSLPHLIDDLDRFSVSLGEELVELLEEYKHMSMRYTSLHQSLEVEGINPVHLLSRTSTPEPSRTMLEPINATYEETFVKTHLQLKNITKNILRLLNRGSPITDDSDTLSAISNTAVHTLETALTQFMDIVQEKLLTTSIDEKRKTDHIKATRQREVETDTIIQQLEQELAEAQAKRDKEIAQKETLKKQITSEIRTVDRLAQETQRKIEEEGNKMENQENEHYDTTKKKQMEDLNTLKKQFEETMKTNKEIEQSLRKKAYKRETETENWIMKFDHDMGEQQNELETLQEEFAEETEQLKELEERLEVLTVEYDAVVKEREEERIKKEEAQSKLMAMTSAAITIQRVWKAYLIRRGPRKKDKKKGKKGGKKGKKGGKKGKK